MKIFIKKIWSEIHKTHLYLPTGETPAAMQRASATDLRHCLNLALLSLSVALWAS